MNHIRRRSTVFLVVAALIGLVAGHAKAATELIAVGQKAPAFTTRTIEGRPLALKSLRGKVVLLDFWATWCGPCRMSTPMMVHLDTDFRSKGLKVVGMSLDAADTRDQIVPFRTLEHVKYPVTYSPAANTEAAMALGTNVDPDTGLVYDHPIPPSFFLIDRHGRVRWRQIGYSLDEEQVLRKLIAKLLAEN